jgi:hypothetical protein
MKAKTGREGRCYELAWKRISENYEGTLIHASVHSFSLKIRMGHAFVETESGDVVWEPVSDRYFLKADLYEYFEVVEIARYSPEEAMINAAKYGTYGPWEG